MAIHTCATCAIEHPDSTLPPEVCKICSDERQWVPVAGQQWVTREQLVERGYRVLIEELETDLYAVRTEPKLGIGQRGLLLRTEAGNLLFEPPGFIDEAAIARLQELGGVSVIASSHPHLTGSSIQYSHAFNHAPVYVARADEPWIRRPDTAIILWEGSAVLLPGVIMHQCGGHFAGSSVVHWPAGRGGAGVLLTGDTIGVGGDRKSAHAMRSYVNNIPLPARAIERILDTVLPLEFEGLYTAFGTLEKGARETVDWSLRRYISWVNGEMAE
ncbi:hydrolase [Paeniglutamicibacter antarcticus]|uniref:MBL fold metallo-hydrolase n=1 Tax=Paeniglutamicibacter antarcticus TaxID=494023 RepID=A0ABP9TJ58_9MICC